MDKHEYNFHQGIKELFANMCPPKGKLDELDSVIKEFKKDNSYAFTNRNGRPVHKFMLNGVTFFSGRHCLELSFPNGSCIHLNMPMPPKRDRLLAFVSLIAKKAYEWNSNHFLWRKEINRINKAFKKLNDWDDGMKGQLLEDKFFFQYILYRTMAFLTIEGIIRDRDFENSQELKNYLARIGYEHLYSESAIKAMAHINRHREIEEERRQKTCKESKQIVLVKQYLKVILGQERYDKIGIQVSNGKIMLRQWKAAFNLGKNYHLQSQRRCCNVLHKNVDWMINFQEIVTRNEWYIIYSTKHDQSVPYFRARLSQKVVYSKDKDKILHLMKRLNSMLKGNRDIFVSRYKT